ncbi:hypothetical protein OEZ86_007249 [Tetradesmus obliquus]|nr:hypothetical protein OEZ86_007249 [Tetradesmus obliquus]
MLSAGVAPWGRASAAVSSSSSSSRGAAMATAAAAGSSSAGTSDTGVLVVYVTAPSAEVADSLASALVEGKLAACVNIVPGLTSVYSWKGKIEKDPELLLIIKTQASLLENLTAKVKQLHPYDEPEVLALPVVGGSASYLAWVRDSTTAGAAGEKE